MIVKTILVMMMIKINLLLISIITMIKNRKCNYSDNNNNYNNDKINLFTSPNHSNEYHIVQKF